MKLRHRILKSVAAVVLACGLLAGCSGVPGELFPELPSDSASSSSNASSKPETPASRPNDPSSGSSSSSSSSSSSNSSASSSSSSSSSSSASSESPASSDSKNDPANLEAYRQEVLRLVNIERQKEGLQPLTMDNSALSAAAQVRAKEIVELFEHYRPDGTKCYTALQEQGVDYWYAGENIAAGYQTPAQVVDGWMNSPGHRANILNPNFKKLGVGYYYSFNSEYGAYWVQMFIG